MAEKDVQFSGEPKARKTAAKAPERSAEASSDSKAGAAPLSVTQLPEAEEVAARTSPEAQPGNRFSKVFVVKARDWDVEGPVDDMHRANQVATLQEALNRGLHPQGGAQFDGAENLPDGKSVSLTYSVAVVLASEDEDPASAYTPKFAVDDFGGSTIKDAAQAD